MKDLRKLIAILKETRALVAREDSDFLWSAWADQSQALSEIDSIIAELENGTIPEIGILFAPTGPIQELSCRSGWGNEFLVLAGHFDKEFAILRNQL